MRHVDYAHDAKGDGQADRRKHQYRTKAESEEHILYEAVDLQFAVDTLQHLFDLFRGQRILGFLL